jgi:hypothetical protein
MRRSLEIRASPRSWNLWHGNVRRALAIVDDLACDVASLSNEYENRPKLQRMLREFSGYIDANRALIPNYGESLAQWRSYLNGVCRVRRQPDHQPALS